MYKRKEFLITSLAVVYPEVALDWHPDKNLPLTALSIGSTSNKKVWWKCHKCLHEWQAFVVARTTNRGVGTKCPNCIGRVINEDNNFAKFNPELVKEWHTTKNGDITPYDVAKTTIAKYWWKCSICDHEWEASCLTRSCGRGCPLCGEFKNRKVEGFKKWKKLNRTIKIKENKS